MADSVVHTKNGEIMTEMYPLKTCELSRKAESMREDLGLEELERFFNEECLRCLIKHYRYIQVLNLGLLKTPKCVILLKKNFFLIILLQLKVRVVSFF